jgi:hypothetical protein
LLFAIKTASNKASENRGRSSQYSVAVLVAWLFAHIALLPTAPDVGMGP